MSEANFLRLFPEQEGYRFLLVSAPATELRGDGDDREIG